MIFVVKVVCGRLV
ncbi:hypothetical protein M2H02_21495 [Vibrio vulnificus]|nr:hypothetical protein [Vibrio vulnificus]MCG6291294.1 hypothetical protein [Vibrio vulnificus]MCJ0807051.1 hypothetical protein [Vibrio vulnificus]MCJ0815234.1 hypothetical protein [Vibrio vulnificus]MCJ0819649.1 hypothetical protein [Vibrio vulnificus]